MALFSIRTNSRWRRPPSWMAAAAILDNFEWPYLRNRSRSTYIGPSAHRAVVFAIAQLSCLLLTQVVNPLHSTSVSLWSLSSAYIKATGDSRLETENSPANQKNSRKFPLLKMISFLHRIGAYIINVISLSVIIVCRHGICYARSIKRKTEPISDI